METLIQLFLSFVQVGAFSFGGGMAAMPLIMDQVVYNHTWIDAKTFTDLVTIAEMTPGPIAINAATFVGTHIAGVQGAIAATLGCLLPSCVIVSLMSFIFTKYSDSKTVQGVLNGLKIAVVALIATAFFKIANLAFFGTRAVTLASLNYIAVILFVVAFVVLRKFKLNPILVMMSCGVVGGSIYFLLAQQFIV